MISRLIAQLAALLERVPLLNRLPFVRARRGADWRQVLTAVPVRNRLLEWSEEEDETIVLRVPQRRDGWVRVLNRMVKAPDHRQVALDEIGSDVWRLCDGETSVEAIIRALANKYKLNRREVELSLSLYLRQLARRGYLGLVAGEAESMADRPEGRQRNATQPKTGSSNQPGRAVRRKKKRCRQTSSH